MTTEAPKYRQCIGTMLTVNSYARVKPPEGYIGFYMQLANGDGLCVLASPDQTWEFSSKMLNKHASRMSLAEKFPMTIWAWEDSQALLISCLLNRMPRGIISDMFFALRAKTTQGFDSLFAQLVDVVCDRTPMPPDIGADGPRMKEALRDVMSFYRREIAQKDGAA